jgi:restriction system protein
MAKGPQFVRYFGPVLAALDELGGSGHPQEVVEKVADNLKVPEDVRAETIPSGNSRFENRVHWSRFYLAKAGYIDASHRGVWALSDQGRQHKGMSHQQALELFKKIHAELAHSQISGAVVASDAQEIDSAPTEGEVSLNYRDNLLSLLKSLPPAGFERLCQRLLRESGFEQVIITGRSGDGGIDGHGVLQVNPFVSFTVLFQCKRYAGVVTPDKVRDFRGAMVGRADKGIIITTGSFTADAHKEALRDGAPPIELVNGEKLLDLFEKLELGLIPRRTFEIDDRFFNEYRKQ